MSEESELDIKKLEKFLKTLKLSPARLKVGILGSHAARKDGSGKTNAEIGACHEFGTTTLPVRSFLRLPISAMLDKGLQKSGAFTRDTQQQVMQQGTVVPWLKKVGVVAEGIVAEAFQTGGFGTWVPSNMAHKRVAMTLVETQQLRNSISSEVVEGG